MQELNLPPFEYKLSETDGKRYILDSFRKRLVLLTPEEWVRQHFLHWLTGFKDYPAGLIAVEAALKYLRLKKRADAIVYGTSGKPLMIIECKAPGIKITRDVFDQIARYNFSFRVDYLAVTNGLVHYCCRMEPGKHRWTFLSSFPDFTEINTQSA